MKRIWKISEVGRLRELLCANPRLSSSPYPKTSPPFCFTITRSLIHPPVASEVSGSTRTKLSTLFAGTSSIRPDDMIANVSALRDELLRCRDDSNKVGRVLDEKGLRWFKSFHSGDAVVELLRQLHSWPSLALQVFDWRRKEAASGVSLTSEEYAKGIMLSGRVKNMNLAAELFKEAAKKQLNTTSTYNAMMGAYVWTGQTEKCKSLFEVFKQDRNCRRSVATYNILISNYGRLMMVDRMESLFREIKVLKMEPNLSTYNNLIGGYVTAWMWDKMETTFQMMKAAPVKPDINTHVLMLRGYANSLSLINEALERKTHLLSTEATRSIVASYFRCKAVDKLAEFYESSSVCRVENVQICVSWYDDYVRITEGVGRNGECTL